MQANQGLAGLPIPGIDSSRTEAELQALEDAGELPLKQLVCPSDGTTLYWCPTVSTRNAVGAVVTVDGVDYLVKSDGSLMPLLVVSGTPHEPTVAGTVEQVFTIDSGDDNEDHVELLITANATTGDPDTADTDLASARFSLPDGNALVFKTLVIGASAGPTLCFYGLTTMMHFALRGAGPYTQAAANVCTALQMVLMKWASTLEVNVVEVRIGTSFDSDGLQVGAKRYRQVTVTGYSA